MINNDLLKILEDIPYKKVKVAITDIDGVLRGKIMLKEKFLEAIESGFGFCDVVFGWDMNDKCYSNSAFTGWHTAYPDAKAGIDTSTFRQVPWNDNIPFFLADFSNNGEAGLDVCPRTLLKRVVKKAEDMGYFAKFSQEFEWFNFLGTSNDLSDSLYTSLKPITPGMFGYSMLRPSQHQDYFNDLFDLMEQFDVALEGLHTETGPGVYEAAIRYDDVLRAADKAVLFKTGVKELAYKHGILATFMAKWNENLPGCSGHLHQSLWDKNGKSLFYNLANDKVMTTTMESYLAGILHCMPHVMPMYAPTINSYKRLRTGAWAPVNVSWGVENRTTAVRLINGSEKSTRLELRLPGADVNPYLAMAASLASGLYGIENNLKLNVQATIGDAYSDTNRLKLFTNLNDATQAMRSSDIASTLFGPGFVNHFCETREWEWNEYTLAVTNWELKRYFEII